MDISALSLGPLMRRNAPTFFGLLKEQADRANAEVRRCVYLELGIMSGDTLLGACQWLVPHAQLWAAYGVDLNGGPWLREEERPKQISNLKAKAGSHLEAFNDGTNPEEPCVHNTKCGIYLTGTERFLAQTTETFDFVFLDACHEYECCKNDFLWVEPKVRVGGIIAFHDTNPDIQGGDIQQHQKKPLEVRRMLQDVGLLGGTREGWKFLHDLIHPVHSDRGCVFVQRA